ncbi:hypothetical protein LTS18_006606, partial [Coniosporium uncinatum]
VGSAPLDGTLTIPIFEFMVLGKRYVGAIEGHATPSKYVPQMIQWYREGRFPVDKLVKTFPAEEFEKAIHEMHDATTVKPVIVW